MLTDNLLGAGMQPADFPEIVRTLHAEVQRMRETLSRRGWTLDRDELNHGDILWTHPASYIDVDDQDDHITTTSIRFTPPATAADRDMHILNTAGQPHTDHTYSLGGILHVLRDCSRRGAGDTPTSVLGLAGSYSHFSGPPP
ncbi:hypothetical protein [Leifsonia aquatica]|uniref:hypothetical protein n=1 Tax=Leifsonia aquatica TaxID=144185 RepID=UPI0037F5F905